MLKKLLNKTFGLRDGEIRISFLMQLYIFLIITVLLIVKPTVNALFLSNLGADHLPYGYLLVAFVAIITSYFYNKAIRRFSLLKVTIVSLVFFSLGFILLSFLLHFSILNNWVLYIYYLGISLFAVIATSQFWILANMIYNSREAKRLFGFIGAGAIAGGVFGGYLTSLVVSAYGNKVVIFLAAILLLCCIPILLKVWKLRLSVMNNYVIKQRQFNDTHREEPSLKIISKSRHLLYLALITGISVIVAKLVDFQFSDFASKAIDNPEALAAFFGFWFSTFNVLALVLQLFFTNRVLSKLGVSSTLLILPLGIALGSLLFFTFPELWVLIIIKGIDGSFKQSLNKAAFELSIMPIPLNVKNQAKSYIDVVVDSIATGLSGFMLIFLIRKLDLSTSYITVIVVFFVFVWIVLIYRLREAYYNSFRNNIQSTILSRNDVLNESKRQETTITAARRILDGDDEQAILNLLDRLSNYKMSTLKSSVVKLLDNPSNEIKIEAIKHLSIYDAATDIQKVKALIHEKDDDLVFASLEYVLHHSPASDLQFFKTYLDHSDEYIADAALLCLAKENRTSGQLASNFSLNNRITEKVNVINSYEVDKREEEIAKLLITIAYAELSAHYFFIDKHLENNNSYIKKYAIKAAGISNSEHFVETLLELVAEKQYRKPAIKALKRYGAEITTTIVRIDKTQSLTTQTKRFIPKVVESFKTQNAVSILMRLMKSKDFLIRYEASRSLLKLSSKKSNLIFNTRSLKSIILRESKYYKSALEAIVSIKQILVVDESVLNTNDKDTDVTEARKNIIDVLEEQIETSLKIIFKLLAIIYDENDIKMAYAGILSDVPATKMNSLEFLDNLLKGQLKFKLMPLLELYTLDDGTPNVIVKLKVVKEKTCLTLLVKSRGKRIKLEVLHLIKVLNDPRYTSLVASLKKHHSIEVKYAATQTLKHLNRKQG